MKKEDWDEWEKLYAKFEEARAAYERSVMELRGVFSELARHYDQNTIDHNRLYEEQLAHEAFVKAREKLDAFLKTHIKNKK